jgi:hypothetical protein
MKPAPGLAQDMKKGSKGATMPQCMVTLMQKSQTFQPGI